MDKQVEAYIAAKQELARRELYCKIESYKPYEKQEIFHNAGSEFKERMMLAGNQYGKSECGAAEAAYHAIGVYPDWWEGVRFKTAIEILVVGNDLSQMRGACQAKLMGAVGEWGTGYIPKDNIVNLKLRRDPDGAIDYALIQHSSGRYSRVWFKSHKQAAASIMGAQFHLIWWDEMPEDDSMYCQGIARTTATQGHYMTTATPENGYTEIVDRFFGKNNAYKNWYCTASLYEAEHLTDDRIEELKTQYHPSEWPMRIDGQPFFGSGKLFPIDDQEYLVDYHEVSIFEDWKRIAGIDFGYQESITAIVWVAESPLSKTRYLYSAYGTRRSQPHDVAPVIHQKNNEAGFRIPFAWPLDGRYHERSTGNVIAEEYEKLGVNMIPEDSRIEGIDGKVTRNVMPGVSIICNKLMTGKYKIFGCWDKKEKRLIPTPETAPVVEDMRRYMRDKKGDIIKKFDNFPDAMRYAENSTNKWATAGGMISSMQGNADDYSIYDDPNDLDYYQRERKRDRLMISHT